MSFALTGTLEFCVRSTLYWQSTGCPEYFTASKPLVQAIHEGLTLHCLFSLSRNSACCTVSLAAGGQIGKSPRFVRTEDTWPPKLATLRASRHALDTQAV